MGEVLDARNEDSSGYVALMAERLYISWLDCGVHFSCSSFLVEQMICLIC